MRVAGQPDGRLVRARRRLAGAAIAPLPVAAAGAVVVVGVADSWRLALLAAAAAGAVAATGFRGCGRAALALLAVAALLALGGWGPGFDRRPAKGPASAARGAHHHHARGAHAARCAHHNPDARHSRGARR